MSIYGNSNGTKIFSIPVEWVVTENLEVQANSIEEAVQFILANADLIPLGQDADYVDGTYKISADESDDGDVEAIVQTLKLCGYSESEAQEYNCVDTLY